MLWPHKNTPVDAYKVPVSLLPFVAGSAPVAVMTCRPTYYTLLFFAGLGSFVRPFVDGGKVVVGSTTDYVVYGACLLVAFLGAQVAELFTRPARRDLRIAQSIRGDRVPRMLNGVLALSVVMANQAVYGISWGGQLTAITTIFTCTVIYHTYGKRHLLYGTKRPLAKGRRRRRQAQNPRTA